MVSFKVHIRALFKGHHKSGFTMCGNVKKKCESIATMLIGKVGFSCVNLIITFFISSHILLTHSFDVFWSHNRREYNV